MKRSLQQNWRLYLMEGLGLAIFMISACLFGGILEAKTSFIHRSIPNDFLRTVIMAVLMGATAVFIFYSRLTALSGAHINPAVTIALLRAGRINKYDSIFYIIFQFIGGTIAVYMMQALMGNTLTAAPVNSVVTVPGKAGIIPAIFMEFFTAFIMMTMVLFTSSNDQLKKYTRIIAGCMVCLYVVIAGPVSGFGMNPARTFASALPSYIWTAFWIYLIMPISGMLLSAEIYLFIQRKKKPRQENREAFVTPQKKRKQEAFEFVL